MCSDIFRSEIFSCQTTGSWVHGVIGAVFVSHSKQTLYAAHSSRWRTEITTRKAASFPHLQTADLFFCPLLLLPFFPLLASICLLFFPAFSLVCVAAVLGTCLHFLSTSDLQMNCMLRSWSTRPLVRSWTMRSMTWHLCRCSHVHCASASRFLFSVCVSNLQTFQLVSGGSYVPYIHFAMQK